MRWILWILILYVSTGWADVIDDSVNEAIADAIRKPMMSVGANEAAVKAVSKGIANTSSVKTVTNAAKRTKKYVEKKTYKAIQRNIGIKKEHAVAMLAVGMGVTQGKLGTKGIKYRIRPAKNVTMRPDLVYDFRGRELSSMIKINWEF